MIAVLSVAYNPRTALFWDPDMPAAREKIASEEIQRPGDDNANAAASTITALLARDPLSSGALSSLGVAMLRRGDVDRAATMMAVAAAHDPTDLPSHLWLYDQAFEKGDCYAALAQANILLSARPGLVDQIGPSLVALIRRSPENEAALGKMLATSPYWRPYLLRNLMLNLKDRGSLVRLYTGLQKSLKPPVRDELFIYLERLTREGAYDDAYLAWLNSLPRDRLKQLGLLYNNRFQYAPTNLPFDWQITQTPGAWAGITNEPEPSLKLEFYGGKIAFANVSHLMTLAPGAYAFMAEAKAQNFESERGLRWRVFCVSDPSATLASTELLKISTPASEVRMAFKIPEAKCRTQSIVAEIPVRGSADWRTRGTVYYSNIRVLPKE